jgi:hypothetical protein
MYATRQDRAADTTFRTHVPDELYPKLITHHPYLDRALIVELNTGGTKPLYLVQVLVQES